MLVFIRYEMRQREVKINYIIFFYILCLSYDLNRQRLYGILSVSVVFFRCIYVYSHSFTVYIIIFNTGS